MYTERNTKDLLADAKFYESYSRYNDTLGRYETWNESVERVMNMHRSFYKEKMTDELSNYIDFAEKLYKEKKILGSQRALQFAGESLLKHHARSYNCAASHVSSPKFFGETLYLLLCGVGVGFSVQRRHVNKLPKVLPRLKQSKVFTIPDSIEGWADALAVLISSFFEGGGTHPEYEGRKVFFEYHKIRNKGEFITGGFKAPGPDPLRNALNRIENILISVAEQKRQLYPIEVYDIVMHAADAVLSGGVRRCLPEWYEVKTTDGWKKISDIKVNVDKVKIPEGEFLVTDKFNQGIQDLVKIKTKSGYHISTPNHRWLVLNKETNTIEWIEASLLEDKKYSFLKPK